MVEKKTIRVVTEDAQVGGIYNRKHEKSYGHGYDGFVYPYTVSFYGEGKYEVVIKGKKATVVRVE